MLQDYVEKYANMLSGRDVAKLFEHLKAITSRAEAARICELERRTTFYWTDDKEIRLQTKKRVLQALLEKDYLFTLNYLCDITFELSNETIDIYLKSLYENAMNPQISNEQFKDLMETFFQKRVKYSSLIATSMFDVVSDMTRNLEEQAAILEIATPRLPLSIMSGEEVMEKLPSMIKMLPKSLTEAAVENIERRFKVPKEFVLFASEIQKESCALKPLRIIDYKNTAQNLIVPTKIQRVVNDAPSISRLGFTNNAIQSTHPIFHISQPLNYN